MVLCITNHPKHIRNTVKRVSEHISLTFHFVWTILEEQEKDGRIKKKNTLRTVEIQFTMSL